MENKDINRCIDRFLAGEATDDEIQFLNAWYTSAMDKDVEWELEGESEEDVKNRIHNSIVNNIKAVTKQPKIISWLPYASVAAVVLVVLFTILFWSKQTDYSLVVKSPVEQLENRHVLLPDSSVVIIRPGGELLVAEDFGVNDRRVELIGEAYFEVKSNKEKPFIILTENVKTTVLGTAFSIKAKRGDGSVEVVVDHGKVRVEKEEKVVAFLEADQKLVIDHTQREKKVVRNIKEVTKQELAWKEEDMHFESMSFGDLVKKLERRYDVQITFKNMDLSLCKMSGVFEGTENLDDVLTNLCLTSNSAFKKTTQGIYEITGERCFN